MAHIQPDHIEVDALLQQPANRGPVLEDAELACVHEVNFVLDVAEESLWFRRLPAGDELWIGGERPGRVARMDVTLSKPEAAGAMLSALMAARHGREFMESCLTPGLISPERYSEISATLDRRIDDNTRHAEQQADANIVATARRLGLNPRPTGRVESRWRWRCRCPWEKAHYLLLNTHTGMFECGWCQLTGSAIGLENVASRA